MEIGNGISVTWIQKTALQAFPNSAGTGFERMQLSLSSVDFIARWIQLLQRRGSEVAFHQEMQKFTKSHKGKHEMILFFFFFTIFFLVTKRGIPLRDGDRIPFFLIFEHAKRYTRKGPMCLPSEATFSCNSYYLY